MINPEDQADRMAVEEKESGVAGSSETPPAKDSANMEGQHHEREGSPPSRGIQEISKDLNDMYIEVRDFQRDFTAEFIRNATREELHTKEQEFKTMTSVYNRAYEEMSANISKITEESAKNIREQKTQFNTMATQVQASFNSSRFARASNQVKQLDVLVNKVKDGKAGITEEYLKVATVTSLELNKEEHSKAYRSYVTAFSAINVADLTADEITTLSSQKAEVDIVSNSIISFFDEQINKKKGMSGQDTVDPKVKPTPVQSELEKTIKHERLAHEKQLADVNQELERLRQINQTTQAETDERIQNLEARLKTKPVPHKDSEFSDIAYQDEIDGPDDVEQVPPTERAIVTLKLDSIQLPYFNGDLTTWEAFRDLFEYLIDKSTKLSDTVKFHQLRSHLKGIAFDTIRGYQLTGSNYKAAWSDLKKRFDRKEDLVDEYIRKFLEIPVISNKAQFISLRHIVDTTNQMLRALPTLSVPVDHWDPFINLIVLSKLDEETRHEWKQRKGTSMQPSKDLINWLETRINELQPSTSDRLSKMLKGEPRRNHPRKVFQVNEKKKEKAEKPSQDPERVKKCLLCGGNHKVKECFKFINECAKARTEIVKTLKLCFKCLLKHQLGICDKEDCNYCGGPHNVMLCYKKENERRRHASQSSATHQPSTSQPSKNRTNMEEDWDQPSTSKNGRH